MVVFVDIVDGGDCAAAAVCVVAGQRDEPIWFVAQGPVFATHLVGRVLVCGPSRVGTPHGPVVVHSGDLQVVHAALRRSVAGGPQLAAFVLGDVQVLAADVERAT